MSGAAREPWPLLAVAVALALGSSVSLGLSRFAYSLLLPPMRSDLGWSYLTAGAMNTVNAAGYLAGALAAPWCVRRFGARPALLVGMAGTSLALAAHGIVLHDAALYAMRVLSGAISAVAFVAGGLLAAQLVGSRSAGDGKPASAGLVLGIYYGGTGIGVVAASLMVPGVVGRAVEHAWQGAWWLLGVLGLVATAVTAIATREGAGPAPPVASGTASAPRRFDWRPFWPGLAAYVLFGLGYIGYITFIVTLLREHRLSFGEVAAFYGLLGAAIMASPWLWAWLLQRYRGGEPACLLNGLLALATLLPVLTGGTVAAFVSGLLFGGVLLSVVASTTALVRHNLPAADWPAGIGAFTIAFAAGQIVGPSLVGFVADRFGGLQQGLACSAALLLLASVIASRQKPLPLPAG